MEIALDSQTVNVSLSHTQLLIWFGGGLVTLFGAIWAVGILFLNQINRRFADQMAYFDRRFTDLRSYMDQRFEAVLSDMGENRKDVREIRNFLMLSAQAAFGSQGTSEAWVGAPQPERRDPPVPPSPKHGDSPTAPDGTAAAPRQGSGGQQGEATQSLSASGRDPEN